MPTLHGDPFRRWEEEVRQASIGGFEGLLPPATEWDSFLHVAAPDYFGGGTGLPWEMEAETAVAPEPPPAPADNAAPPDQSAQPPGSIPASSPDAPEAQLPDNLRAEIEDFLNRDRPTPASEDELTDYLRGGFDPNLEPEK